VHSYLRAAPVVCLLLVPRGVAAQPPAPDARDFLLGNGCPAAACDTARGAALWSFVQSFYAGRGYALAWSRDGEPTGAGRAVLRALASAERDGLDPRRYDPRAFAPASTPTPAALTVTPATTDPVAVLDVGLTYGILRYASDLAQGLAGPVGRGPGRWASASTFDPGVALEEALGGGADRMLAGVRPPWPQYAALAQALGRYRQVAASGGWPALVVKPGAGRRAPVPGLRERLTSSGDARLQDFQARHGLNPTGRLDAATLAALNVPVEDRIRQIELNLDRWRWHTRPSASRVVLVNIPTFELHAYEDGREALRMRVVTGQGDSPTPVFTQEMTHVVFSPSWTVPPNIAAMEVLPAVQRDRSYLRRRGLEVVLGDRVVDPARLNWRGAGPAVQFRQRPGARNALGGVKFLLPNPFHVYLHDTPDDHLFARPRRTFSHGCVRLEKPEALARWVLGDPETWTPARIRAAMWRGREHHVPLAEPIPVSIAYFTAWVADDGTIQFRPDVYRHDAAQSGLLPSEPPPATVLAFREAGA
jgi:L,D-transpeptidase YcbB